MALPPLPPNWEDGYHWMEQLSGGWHSIPGWGSEGWDLGSWPYVVVAHYNGDEAADMGYGLATYVEGDITVKEFPTRDKRNRETDEIAIFYWRLHEHPRTAPKDIDDPRLGPYRQL